MSLSPTATTIHATSGGEYPSKNRAFNFVTVILVQFEENQGAYRVNLGLIKRVREIMVRLYAVGLMKKLPSSARRDR